jgi:nucleoside-diphosphate-sugar epimerase
MVLVTGASGFLGQHLVAFLSRRGKAVRALYNGTAPDEVLKKLSGVEWQKCDLLDVYAVEEAMRGIEEVYHCAAIVSFHPSEKVKMVHFNVEGTTNIVNEALEQNIRKLVFVSSVAALGRSEAAQKEVAEEAQWDESKYNSAYGLSKHLSEMEVWRGMAEGLDAVVVNPGIILGAPFSNAINSGKDFWDTGSARLMKVVDSEFPFYTQGVNAWVDVEDVVNAMTGLMDSQVSGERFVISAGNFSYREIFTEMAKALNKKAPSIKAGTTLTELVWRWSMLRSVLFRKTVTITKETAKTSQKKVYYNNGKLVQFLPDFTYTPIKETIDKMAHRYGIDKAGRN